MGYQLYPGPRTASSDSDSQSSSNMTEFSSHSSDE